MGFIKRILAKQTLDNVPKFWNKVRIEAGEEKLMHFHWRDLRILFSPVGEYSQFKEFTKTIVESLDGTEKFEDGKDIYVSMRKIPDKIIFGNEMKIEEQINGDIHFHYRDTRLELSAQDFMLMSDLFNEAKYNYLKKWEQMIKIEEINPWDKHHFVDPKDWIAWNEKDYLRHHDGIEKVKVGIKNGGEILPILVCEVKDLHFKYQRLDGFKRYMAYKELEFNKIPCYVVKLEDLPKLRQHERPWWRVKPK